MRHTAVDNGIPRKIFWGYLVCVVRVFKFALGCYDFDRFAMYCDTVLGTSIQLSRILLTIRSIVVIIGQGQRPLLEKSHLLELLFQWQNRGPS